MASENNQMKTLCPCGSGKTLAECCLDVISGVKKATSAEALMRSRYTAYAMGEMSYILSSWHVSTRPSQVSTENNISWRGLKVLRSVKKHRQESTQYAEVEFIASFINDGIERQMHECSQFVYEDDRWFYVDGVQIEGEDQQQSKKPGRNEKCACGSGKKFKKCCGNNR